MDGGTNKAAESGLHSPGEITTTAAAETKEHVPRRSWSSFGRRTPRTKSSSAPDNKLPGDNPANAAAAAPPESSLTSSSASSSPVTVSLSTTSASYPTLTSSLSSSAIPINATSSSTSSSSSSGTTATPSLASMVGLPLHHSTSSLLGGNNGKDAVVERRSSGLKWFRRSVAMTPGSPAPMDRSGPVSPRGADVADKPKDQPASQSQSQPPETPRASAQPETICPVSYADLKRQLDTLKRENNRLRFENSHLFKELDIVHRRLSVKLNPPARQPTDPKSHDSSLDILNSHTAYSYNIDTDLSYQLPLDEFLEQYYKDYPESLADLTIYQRKGKLASFSMRNGVDGVEDDERSKIKAHLESALITQEDGKFLASNGAGQTSRHESFIPTIVKRQFARDVPSMIRINGKIVNGRTDNEKVLIAYRILHDGLAGNEKLVNLVMSLANQNLGIFMYEKLVRHYTQIGMIVKQSWHHYLDISLSRVRISKYINNKNVINELVDEYLRKERAEKEASAAAAASAAANAAKYEEGVVYLSEEDEASGDSEASSPSQTRRRVRKPRSGDSKTRRRSRRSRRAASKQTTAEESEASSVMIDEEKARLVEGIGIYMLAIFELQNTDLDGAPLFIKGMMEIRFRNSADGGAVHVQYSTPAFDVLSFVHSIDLDEVSSPTTDSSTDESESDSGSGHEEAAKADEDTPSSSSTSSPSSSSSSSAASSPSMPQSSPSMAQSSSPVTSSSSQLNESRSDDAVVAEDDETALGLESEAKMKEVHGDDSRRAAAPEVVDHKEKEATEEPRASTDNGSDNGNASDANAGDGDNDGSSKNSSSDGNDDEEDKVVVVQKGRRRRVMSLRDASRELATVEAGSALDGVEVVAVGGNDATSPRHSGQPLSLMPPRMPSLGRLEDVEWFRRKEAEELEAAISPRRSASVAQPSPGGSGKPS